MKTRCPACRTLFRLTPEQLKARAGKVRCGQCDHVFNALVSLIEDASPAASAVVAAVPPEQTAYEAPPPAAFLDLNETEIPAAPRPAADEAPAAEIAAAVIATPELEEKQGAETLAPQDDAAAPSAGAGTSREPSDIDDLLLPRDTTGIPGYSKWNEGIMAPTSSSAAHASGHRVIVAAVVLLSLLLAGQAAFHFRSELAVGAPSLRPLLETLAGAFGAGIPLPREADLVSIEVSDLQADPSRANLLELAATLRNRADFPQAYPLLELSLTDTQDAVIARRVFRPEEYLPAQNAAAQAFAAKADLSIHLRLEAGNIAAAGYRLFVFYP